MIRQGQAAATTTFRGCFSHTISRKSTGVTLISGIQPVIVPHNNAEDDE